MCATVGDRERARDDEMKENNGQACFLDTDAVVEFPTTAF